MSFTDGASAPLRIWANGGVATGLAAVGLNGYTGTDAQSADPATGRGGFGVKGTGLGGSGGRSGCGGTGSPAPVIWELQAKDIA